MATVKANAKINLTLDILNKRADGYHEVAMVMQAVGLFDTIHLTQAAAGIALRLDTRELPTDEGNLAFRAARVFLDAYHISDGVRIEIEKRIPIAAGLAGGSTDAAGVLRGLNALFAVGATADDLAALGARLGSDVPFCVYGGTMAAAGRGEILTLLPPVTEAWAVLAKPPVAVSTAWAYDAFDREKPPSAPRTAAMIDAVKSGDLERIAAGLSNDLERVTQKAHPVIGEYKRILRENGALNSLMTGSGPTVYALAKTEREAERAAEAIRSTHSEAEVFIVPLEGTN